MLVFLVKISGICGKLKYLQFSYSFYNKKRNEKVTQTAYLNAHFLI
jgi:hypothetical protein